MQITLKAEQERFIQAQIQRGIFDSPDQEIEMALKLLEAQSEKGSSPELAIEDSENVLIQQLASTGADGAEVWSPQADSTAVQALLDLLKTAKAAFSA